MSSEEPAVAAPVVAAAANPKKERAGKRKRKRKSKASVDATEPEAQHARLGGAAASSAAPAAAPRQPGLATEVYVEGIPWDSSEAKLRAFFEGCGNITEVRMPQWHDTGRVKGYAHVAFATAEEATEALKRDREHLGSRYLSVQPVNAKRSVSSAPAKDPPKGCKVLFVKNLPYEVDEEAVTAAFSSFGVIKGVRLASYNVRSLLSVQQMIASVFPYRAVLLHIVFSWP